MRNKDLTGRSGLGAAHSKKGDPGCRQGSQDLHLVVGEAAQSRAAKPTAQKRNHVQNG